MDDDDRSPSAGSKKRAKPTIVPQDIGVASQKLVAVEEGGCSGVEVEEAGAITSSEEMEERIGQILEKIDHFTQQVAEMLEAGKKVFKNLSVEFEERLIATHREQIDRWEEEIRALRLLDGSNEEAGALLQKVRYHLLHNVQMDS